MSYWVTEWLSVWVTEWLSYWVTEWIGERVNELLSDWVNKWTNAWVTEWIIEWVNELLSDWVNEWLSDWATEGLREWVNEWQTHRPRVCSDSVSRHVYFYFWHGLKIIFGPKEQIYFPMCFISYIFSLSFFYKNGHIFKNLSLIEPVLFLSLFYGIHQSFMWIDQFFFYRNEIKNKYGWTNIIQKWEMSKGFIDICWTITLLPDWSQIILWHFYFQPFPKSILWVPN